MINIRDPMRPPGEGVFEGKQFVDIVTNRLARAIIQDINLIEDIPNNEDPFDLVSVDWESYEDIVDFLDNFEFVESDRFYIEAMQGNNFMLPTAPKSEIHPVDYMSIRRCVYLVGDREGNPEIRVISGNNVFYMNWMGRFDQAPRYIIARGLKDNAACVSWRGKSYFEDKAWTDSDLDLLLYEYYGQDEGSDDDSDDNNNNELPNKNLTAGSWESTEDSSEMYQKFNRGSDISKKVLASLGFERSIASRWVKGENGVVEFVFLFDGQDNGVLHLCSGGNVLAQIQLDEGGISESAIEDAMNACLAEFTNKVLGLISKR